MKMSNHHTNRFYLGFNKDTGELVDVIGPGKKGVSFHPDHFKLLHKEDLDEATLSELKDSLGRLRSEIRKSSIPPKRLVFIDRPGNSICGGSCGGIPFEIECS